MIAPIFSVWHLKCKQVIYPVLISCLRIRKVFGKQLKGLKMRMGLV